VGFIAVSVLVFLYNVSHSRRVRNVVGDDPWDGRTLEWTLPSPVPGYNFAEVPVVHGVDDYWHQKYTEDENGRLVKLPVTEKPKVEVDESSIHLPSPSYFPLIASLGLPVMAYGLMYKAYYVAILGGIIVIGALYAWALEPSAEPHDPHIEGGGGGDGADPGDIDTAELPREAEGVAVAAEELSPAEDLAPSEEVPR
jgi:cytochrome c oxidase subunit 1